MDAERVMRGRSGAIFLFFWWTSPAGLFVGFLGLHSRSVAAEQRFDDVNHFWLSWCFLPSACGDFSRRPLGASGM
jgi:hypothetical protein